MVLTDCLRHNVREVKLLYFYFAILEELGEALGVVVDLKAILGTKNIRKNKNIVISKKGFISVLDHPNHVNLLVGLDKDVSEVLKVFGVGEPIFFEDMFFEKNLKS